MSHLPPRIMLAGIVLVGLFAVESRAQACSGLQCDPGRVSVGPPSGSSVPANAPALVAETAWGAAVELFELEAVDGGKPAVTFERVGQYASGPYLLRLGEPLVPGMEYRLRTVSQCSVPYLDGSFPQHEKTYVFTAAPPAPLPSSIGTVRVEYLNARVGGRYGLSIDSLPLPGADTIAVVAQLIIEPSAELAPYLPTTRFSTFVDNEVWAGSRYGRGVVSYEPTPDLVSVRDFTRIHASCGRALSSAACEPGGATLGTHMVKIQADVAGAASNPPPIVVSIDLKCPDAGLDASPDADLDASTDNVAPKGPDGGVEVGEDAAAAIDAASHEAGERSKTPSSSGEMRASDDGCAIGKQGRASLSLHAAWLLAAMLVLGWRRRRNA